MQLGDHSGSHKYAIVASEVPLSFIETGLSGKELQNLFSKMIQIERTGGAQVRHKGQPILDPNAVAIEILGGDALHGDFLLLAGITVWQSRRRII